MYSIDQKLILLLPGPGGLAALKELRHVGFDVTLFERRSDVGGIWTWSEDRFMTTALKETRLCNSKYTAR
jgi:dimethylaniline monooxygenase (N-oxide forming)